MGRTKLNYTKRLTEKCQDIYADFKDFLPSTPRDFAWKVRRRIRYDHNPLFVIVQDKYKVKEYARERGVQSATSFYVTDRPQTIPFSSLPDTCFIKANHGCGWNILFSNNNFYLYKNGRNFHKSGGNVDLILSQKECLEICAEWLGSVYSKREWAYRKIEPKILVEEVLTAPNEEELKEYKFYVFNGFAKAVNIRSATYRQNHQNIFFNPAWQEFKLRVYREKVPDLLPAKPDNLCEMVEIAEKLGRGLDFVRVDLFNTNHGPVLGEMTIYPYGGMVNTPTADPDFNKWLGDQWELQLKR